MTREKQINEAVKTSITETLMSTPNYEFSPKATDMLECAFTKGAEWADAHPKNTWHKASEELPTHFGDYLVVIDSQQFGRRYALKCWYGYPKDFFGDNISKEWVLEEDEIVSYWMAIPEIKEE